HLTERERGGKDFNEDGFHRMGPACTCIFESQSHGKAAGRSAVPFSSKDICEYAAAQRRSMPLSARSRRCPLPARTPKFCRRAKEERGPSNSARARAFPFRQRRG